MPLILTGSGTSNHGEGTVQPMVSDEQLMERCQNDDPAAFEELVERYENLVFSICYRMLDHVEDAKSFTQQTFLKAWENRQSFDPDRDFKPWICGIASNECSHQLRKASSRYEKAGVDDYRTENGRASPEEDLERTELKQKIQSGLNELSTEYRRLIVLKYIGDCSYAEMAEEMGITESAVESRLHRARTKLRDQLEDVGEAFFHE